MKMSAHRNPMRCTCTDRIGRPQPGRRRYAPRCRPPTACIRSKVLTGDIVERTYKKTDGTTFRINVTPYSKSGTHIDETIWIFSCEDAALTLPQTK